MLRSFRVANHRSIRAEQALVLLPAYRSDRPVTPVAGIYGANASGKSNVLAALAWMQAAVADSYGRWQPDRGVPRDPYVLDPAAQDAPSSFSVDFIAGGVRHSYGFAVDGGAVLEEWLHTYPRANRRRMIFEREGDAWRFGSTVPKAKFALLQELTRPNALFLSVAAQSGTPETSDAAQWFQRISFSWPADRVRPRVADVVAYLESSPSKRESLVAMIRAADLGIADVRAKPARLLEGPMLAKPDLEFLHGAAGVALDTWRQSRGTLQWLTILTPVLDCLELGGLLCVDELDASLHPLLVPRLIDLFNEERTNPRNAQLVFTGHHTSLLQEEVLRRDEIWFVEKNSRSGESQLFPLTDFHPRKNENTEGRYLAGSYGAVPVVLGQPFQEAADAALRDGRAA